VNFLNTDFVFDSSVLKKELLNGKIKDVTFYSFENSNQLGFQFSFKINQIEIKTNEDSKQLMLIFRNSNDLENEIINEETTLLKKHGEIKKIVIDPGHGGKDPGAVSNSGMYEKDIVFSIAEKLKEKFEKENQFVVIMTRKEDIYVPLEERRRLANSNGGDVFISIHCNSVSNRKRKKYAQGFETYFLSLANNEEARKTAKLENQAILFDENSESLESDTLKNIVFDLIHNAYLRESQLFARIILEEMEKNLPSTKRKVDQAGFLILKGLYMPGVLIETGFLSNESEEKKLRTLDYQDKIAQSIYQATINFIKQVS